MVSFANTVVIMTSNLGASIMLERGGNSGEARAAVMEVVRRHFRPEFLNRIDEIVQVGGATGLDCHWDCHRRWCVGGWLLL